MKLKAVAVTVLVSLLSACTWWEFPNRYGVLPSVWDSMSPKQQQAVVSAYNEDSHVYENSTGPTRVKRTFSGPKPTYTVTPDGRKRWSLPK